MVQALLTLLICSGVPLACSSVAGFITAFLQAVTQIQEQGILFAVKLATLCVVLMFFGERGARLIVDLLIGGFAVVAQLKIG